MSFYQAGYISVANGSLIVEGLGTRWLNYIRPGDTLIVGEGYFPIAEVMDNHLLRLSMAFNADSVDRGKYRIDRQPVAPSLADIQAQAAAEVDLLAGKTRLKYVTVSPGQEMTYTAKLADAERYIAAEYPADTAPYPWIHAEAQATGATPTQVADLIVYTAGLWTTIGAKIEGARQAAKRSIADAADTAAVQAAVAAFKAEVAAL